MNADSQLPSSIARRSADGGNTMTPSQENPARPEWLELVERQIAALRFGTVQIVVHDGRVTQIESTEKIRFPAS